MDYLNFIFESFMEMEESKKIDCIKLLPKLKDFDRELLNLKKETMSSKNTLKEIFPKFHAIETERRIINTLINRLPIAKSAGDNPIIAEDALAIMPEFILLHDNLHREKVDLLELSNQLQIKAIDHKLYPNRDKIFEGIDKGVLKKEVESFAERVGGIIESE